MMWACAKPILALLASLASLGLALPALAYDVIDLPPGSRRTLNLNLGDTPVATRGYGIRSWNQLAEDALDRWNEVGIGSLPDHGFFEVKRPAREGNPCRRDGTSEVRFAPTLCGWSWGGVLGVTISWIVSGKTVETDVVLNGIVPRDAYPGPLSGALDFFRVLLHELGHAAGLDHPDEAGQSVIALMNAFISDVDDIRADDREGARAVAWDPGAIGRMEAFVRGLYQHLLERAPSAAERKAWSAVVAAGSSSGDMAAALARAFLESDENLARARTLADRVRILYRTLFDRAASEAETAAWVAILLERFDALVPGFVNSPEFLALGARTAPHVIVRRLYQEVLGRQATADEVVDWVEILSATGDWHAVARGFLDSDEYLAVPRTFADHVGVLYRTFLGRSPSAAETSAWVAHLNTQLALTHDAFFASSEFKQRALSLLR